MKPWSRNALPSVSATLGSKPDMTSGVAIGRRSVAISPPASPSTPLMPARRDSSGRSANGRFQFNALRNAAVRPSRVSGNSTCTLAADGLGVSFIIVASVISAMGVMPAIGSFEKLPSA